MTTHSSRIRRLTVYDLTDERTSLPAGATHFVYVRAGSASATNESGPIGLTADQGAFVSGDVFVKGGSRAWLFEETAMTAPFADAEIVASHAAVLDFPGPCIVRVDRIESRHGATTPRHRHRGPGLRRLVFGTLRAIVGDTINRIQEGDAWFETGHEPVVGINYGGTNAAFVRMLVLPAELSGGKSSFVPWDASEAAKPRSVDQRLFGEVD